MAMNLHLNSVHYAPPVTGNSPRIFYDPLTKRQLIVPIALRATPVPLISLKEQMEQAVLNPESFEIAMLRILKDNLPFLRDPRYRRSLCPSVYNEEKCLDANYCRYAGSLAELYANNIYRDSYYKTRPCKYKQFCLYGSQCFFGHEGDLMRKVHRTANRVFTTEWYILDKY